MYDIRSELDFFEKHYFRLTLFVLHTQNVYRNTSISAATTAQKLAIWIPDRMILDLN